MEVALFFYSLGSMWLYSAVISSSLAVVIPFPFLGEYRDYQNAHSDVDLSICSTKDTIGLPTYCHESYLFCLTIFCGIMLVRPHVLTQCTFSNLDRLCASWT